MLWQNKLVCLSLVSKYNLELDFIWEIRVNLLPIIAVNNIYLYLGLYYKTFHSRNLRIFVIR